MTNAASGDPRRRQRTPPDGPMPGPGSRPAAARVAPRDAADGQGTDVWPTVALGFAPPLAALAGVAAAAIATAGAGSPPLAWVLAPTAAAALLTVVAARRMLAALRRAAAADAPGDRGPGLADALAEVDHRVRNALQVMASMLSLELRGTEPSGERDALLRVQSRLHALSLVHGRASALEPSSTVRLDLLAAEVADHLSSEPPPDAAPVEMSGALDPVSAAPERAVAFALFVNEALMTALRRADGGQAAGPVTMSLRVAGDGASLLSIRSAACAAGQPAAAGGALGARLMANCAEQLGGTLAAERHGDAHEVRLVIPSQRAG